jgi:hypothetical protein
MLQQRLLYNPPKRRVPVPMLLVDGCVLHITTFGLKGELQAMDRIKDSYTVSKHAPSFSPGAVQYYGLWI